MNRPFVAVVIAYVAGILLSLCCHPPLAVLFGGAFACVILALAVGRLRPALLWPLLILTGWTNMALHTAIVAPNDLRTVVGDTTEIVTLRGQLAETPKLRISDYNDRLATHSVVPVWVTELLIDSNNIPVSGVVMINTPGVLASNYFAGQSVEIYGVIAPPPRPLAEGLFDYRTYLANRGIYYELKTKSPDDWKLLDSPSTIPPLTDRFLHWAMKTLSIGLPAEDEPLHLLWAMTLGWRTAFVGDIGDPFLRAGTMHLFAIDGLRIALLSAFIVTFFRVFRLSRVWCGFIAVPMIWFYTAATGWEPPAVRASVMMTIVLGGWCLQRPGDLLNSLALAAFIILVEEPRQLFDAGFQLSFFVVLVIALMLPPMNAWIDQKVRQDPLLPNELLPWWQRKLLEGTRLMMRYAALSFAAWVGSIPLSAKYFHLFSPVSTLANIFAVPCGTLALMANMASLICGAWCPRASGLFNHAAWFFMVAMTWVSETACKIPGAYFYVKEPPMTMILIYYAVVVGFLIWKTKGSTGKARHPVCAAASQTASAAGRRQSKIFAASALAILAALIVACLCWWMSARRETTITVLPLNGGHAVYVDGENWLVDCGNADAVEGIIEPCLHAQGVNRIPHLILTEGVAAQCGGAVKLDQLFGVRELWTSAVKFRSPEYSPVMAHYDGSTNVPSRHQILELGKTYGPWQVLHPDMAAATARADDNALVLLGTFHGIRILLLSDLSRDGQSQLLSRTNDLHADIVIAGLPEKSEPLCDDLLKAIKPKVIVIADSQNLATRRAGKALKERLQSKGPQVIYTKESGAVKIIASPTSWMLYTMDGRMLGGWNNGKD